MKTGNVDRPLWAIALTLLMIALCLVVMVIQSLFRQAPRTAEELVSPDRGPSADVAALHRPHPRETVDATPVASRAGPPAQGTRNAINPGLQPPEEGAPALAGEGSQKIGGFAPLNSQGQTNYHTAITGRVTLHGKPPPEEVLNVSRTSACFKANRGRLTTHNYVVGADGALADMLVFIREGLPSWHPLPAYTAATVQFTNCQIRPYQTALPWQEALRIESADGQSHTFEVAPPQGGEVATPVVPGKTAALLLTPVPQLFLPCSCRMHPWESAFVSSFDHPFYAVTGIDGRYTVTNIPPGKYVLAACHQKLTGTNGIVRTVSLRAGEVAHADFVLELPGT